ncbi:reverse transcriptase domain-containing protein [Tanacetum coccineum]
MAGPYSITQTPHNHTDDSGHSIGNDENPLDKQILIKGHLSALKALLKEHNNKNLTDQYDWISITNPGMFQHTLDIAAREWFDRLPPGSIDEWAELHQKFMTRFAILRACFIDPTEIMKIFPKANETVLAFIECTDKTKITRKQVKIRQTRTRERKSTKEAGNSKPKSKSQPMVKPWSTQLNGRRAYNGRALMDFYWLISDKPELLISSFEHFSFCSAEALCVLKHSIGVSSAGLSLKDTCKLVLAIWSFAPAVVTAVTIACMRTRSQSCNLHHQQQQAPPAFVEPFNLEEPIENPAPPVVPMADNRTMAQLLQAPTEGYEDAIVIPKINANFELKHGLINLVQNKQFFGHDKEDPHAHIRYFNKITSTMRFPDIPSTSIKLMLFPFSLEGSARIWLEKEPPRSILTWDDLVSKFINQFFPPSKTTNLRNEITRFQQRFDESFYEAWDRFNDLLRACPHHGFSELHQLDTFYNALNAKDQDSLNSAAVVAKVSSNSSTPGISPDVAALTTKVSELKNMMKTMLIEKQKAQAPAPVKMVEQSCVTYGGAHSYRNFLATDGNIYQDNIQEYVSQAAAANFNQGNTNSRPLMVANQIRPPGSFFQNQASTSGTLPSNTIPNPKGEMKAITTRSGVAYEGPSIPTNPSPKKVVERETKEQRDKSQTNFQGNTAQIPPPVIPISILEPDVPKNLPKPNIPYPSRRDDQKSRDKASNQMEKIFQIFQDLRFDISFADALLLMPRFAPTIKNGCMPRLGRSWRKQESYDFVVVDFEADPRVPLILGRSFLRTSRALIDVYEGELVLRDGNEQITFHVNGTSKHPQKHENESIKMVNDACKDSFKRFTDEPTLVCLPPPEDVIDKKEKQEVKNLAEPTAKRQTRITPCLKNFKVICKESIFHSNKPPQVSLVFAITSTLPSIEPKDSLIMGDDHLSIFSTEEIVPIPRESEETSSNDSKNVLPSCDDFSFIEVVGSIYLSILCL